MACMEHTCHECDAMYFDNSSRRDVPCTAPVEKEKDDGTTEIVKCGCTNYLSIYDEEL